MCHGVGDQCMVILHGHWDHYSQNQCDQLSSSWSLASLSSGSGRGNLKILATPDNWPSSVRTWTNHSSNTLAAIILYNHPLLLAIYKYCHLAGNIFEGSNFCMQMIA